MLSYHAQRPDGGIINQKPSLLCETNLIFLFCDTECLRNWLEDMIHNRSSQSRQYNDAVENHVEVVPPQGIFFSLRIVVREQVEFACALTSSWETDMG